ncbi:MAG TPA: hypothetical protein VMW06_02780, partial [Desulfobacterales bacterium]|nr:hypothetical protein [Desulfobacterales bacterium]
MKKLLTVLTFSLFLLMATNLVAGPPGSPPAPKTGLKTYVLAGMPSAAANTNMAVIMTDGSTATDCTAGGGTTRNICISNGTTWIISGDGTGGVGSGSVTTIESGDAGVGDADIVSMDFAAADFVVTESPDTEVNISIDIA